MTVGFIAKKRDLPVSSWPSPIFVRILILNREKHPFNKGLKARLISPDFWWDPVYSPLSIEERWAWTCLLAYIFRAEEKETEVDVDISRVCRAFKVPEKTFYSCIRKMEELGEIKTDITKSHYVIMANSNPACDIHHVTMKPSKFNRGQYYCPMSTDLGFCKEKFYE